MLGRFLMTVDFAARYPGKGFLITGHPVYERSVETGLPLVILGTGFLYRGRVLAIAQHPPWLSHRLSRDRSTGAVAILLQQTADPDPPEGIQAGMDVYLLPPLDGLEMPDQHRPLALDC